MPNRHKILVTGANGQLGCEFRRLGETSPNDYIFTDMAELDITDKVAVERMIEAEQVDIIINCAAYTNVERAEEEADVAERINAHAVENLAQAAAKNDATLFHISTDYVFDGKANTPITEDMPTNPPGVYGRTKLQGEKAITASGCKAIIIRTAWLYSEFGNNFLKTMLRLTSEREHINVVFDQVGTPTYAGDLALAIFSIIEGNHYADQEGIYHFSNEGVCSWYDFAVEIARAVGNTNCRINPCRSKDFPTKARRPAYSVLDKDKIKRTFGIEIPQWRESMFYCLKRLLTQNK